MRAMVRERTTLEFGGLHLRAAGHLTRVHEVVWSRNRAQFDFWHLDGLQALDGSNLLFGNALISVDEQHMQPLSRLQHIFAVSEYFIFDSMPVIAELFFCALSLQRIWPSDL